MKFFQKTLLATAVAIAISPAAFAEVTLSGKAAAELVSVTNDSYSEKARGMATVSDGLSFKLAGEYDIVGDNKAGFEIGMTFGGNKTWGDNADGKNETVKYDASHIFISGDFGKVKFGKVTMPSDDVAIDFWGNSKVAGAAFYHGQAVGSSSNAMVYSNEFGPVSFAFGLAPERATNRNGGPARFVSNGKNITSSGQFVYDAYMAYNLFDDTHLAFGVQYDAGSNDEGATTAQVSFNYEDMFSVSVSSSDQDDAKKLKNRVTSAIIGAKYPVSEMVTAKATFSTKMVKDVDEPMQFAVGADIKLADNIVSHVVFDAQDSGKKDAEIQYEIATGITVKF